MNNTMQVGDVIWLKSRTALGFETFGADVKAARKAEHLKRKMLAEMVGIGWCYLANIENKGRIPSLPVTIQLIKVCGLPVERYFNPEVMREESAATAYQPQADTLSGAVFDRHGECA